jgi:signal transduction histidine kinase
LVIFCSPVVIYPYSADTRINPRPYSDAGKAVRLSGHCERPLLTRPRTLRRIISNLLDNALKFGKDPELLFLSESEECVAIVVRDEGPGIPEDQMNDVLRPFYRIESSRKSLRRRSQWGKATTMIVGLLT